MVPAPPAVRRAPAPLRPARDRAGSDFRSPCPRATHRPGGFTVLSREERRVLRSHRGFSCGAVRRWSLLREIDACLPSQATRVATVHTMGAMAIAPATALAAIHPHGQRLPHHALPFVLRSFIRHLLSSSAAARPDHTIRYPVAGNRRRNGLRTNRAASGNAIAVASRSPACRTVRTTCRGVRPALTTASPSAHARTSLSTCPTRATHQEGDARSVGAHAGGKKGCRLGDIPCS